MRRGSVGRSARRGRDAMEQAWEVAAAQNGPTIGTDQSGERLWFVPPGSRELVSPYVALDGDQPIEPGAAVSVSLIAAVLGRSFESAWRGDNDVLLASRSAWGGGAVSRRIHAWEPELPVGTPIRDLLADSVALADGFESSRLWLELEVVEVDRLAAGPRQRALSQLRELGAAAGAIYPTLLPWLTGAGAAGQVLHTLISALEKDVCVLRVPVALHGVENGGGRPGRALLREGAFVAFDRSVDATDLQLSEAGTLSRANLTLSQASYVVFDIRSVAGIERESVVQAEVAALVEQLRGDPSGVMLPQALETLTEAVTDADLLHRWRALRRDDGSLTEVLRQRWSSDPALSALLGDSS